MVFLENVYYIIIVAWTLFYIMNTFFSLGSGLPWSDCEKGGQPACPQTLNLFLSIKPYIALASMKRPCLGLKGPYAEIKEPWPNSPYFFTLAGSWADERCFNPEGNVSFLDSDAYLKYNFTEKETITPVESYWK